MLHLLARNNRARESRESSTDTAAAAESKTTRTSSSLWHRDDEGKQGGSDDHDGEDDQESVDGDSPPGSSSSLASSSDLSVVRMNFLRLLHRCEETSFHHLHPPAGTTPCLQSVDGVASRAAKTFFKSVSLLQREFLPEFRRRRARIHSNKENGEYIRRVAFLATLSEKEAQSMQPGLTTREEKATYPSSLRARLTTHTGGIGSSALGPAIGSLAHGVHSIRTAAALFADANSAVVAASSSVAQSSDVPTIDDDSLDSLFVRAAPPGPAAVDHMQELRAQLFARQATETVNGHGSTSSSAGGAAAAASSEFHSELAQRALLADLHDMTGSLKSNALRLRAALSADAAVVSQVDAALERNLSSIAHENSRLKRWASAGCSDMCQNILLIVVIWVVFIATFIFMKIFPAPK